MIQELWLLKVDWDSPLPAEFLGRWNRYRESLTSLRAISIPRWTNQSKTNCGVELHGFADASNRAYAAAVYVRVLASLDEYLVMLLMSKTKVAPVKTISIPRLELCAAVLLARLIKHTLQAFDKDSIPVYCWSDSTVTLSWIKQHPSCWKTFVANRVSEIQTLIPRAKWGYVCSKQNPADCATRGVESALLRDHPLWWKGPYWLSQHTTAWPEPLNTLENEDSEKRTIRVLTADRDASEWSLPKEISSWPRLLRVTAFCMMFIDKIIRRLSLFGSVRPLVAIPLETSLTCYIKRARLHWIRHAQQTNFRAELRALKNGQLLPSSSRLRKLDPFLDPNELIRVGGRLNLSSLSYSEKHPIILPRHRISELLVEQTHLRCLHGGPQMTLRVLRQEF